jgi:hypothetical protein
MTLYKITIPVSLNAGETTQHGFHVTSTTDLADVTSALADAFVSGIGTITAFKSLFPGGQTWGPAFVQQIDQTTGKVVATAFGTATFTATGGTTGLPQQCAEVITMRTALAGPSFRGRMYLPPVTITALGAGGILVTANVTTILNAYANAFIALIADGGSPGVWSDTHKTFTPITQVEVDNIIDTQRRRAKKQTGARQSHLV